MSLFGNLFSNNNSNNNNRTYVNNSDQPTKYLELTCFKCGGKLNLDLDHLQAFCPYCGEKLMIDTNQLGIILAEKEETKRKELELEHEEKMEKYRAENQEKKDKSDLKVCAVMGVIAIALMLLLSLSFSGDKRKINNQTEHLESLVREIKVDMDNKDYDSAMYKANQLIYSDTGYSSSEENLVKKWDKIREDTIKMIEEAKARDSGTETTNTAVTFKGGGLQLFYPLLTQQYLSRQVPYAPRDCCAC